MGCGDKSAPFKPQLGNSAWDPGQAPILKGRYWDCLNFFFNLFYLSKVDSGSAGKDSACNAGDLGSIPGLGRSPGEGKGYPLQYSGLENSINCIVHGVARSRTRLSDFHIHD